MTFLSCLSRLSGTAPALRRTCLALVAVALASSAYFVQGAGMNQNSRFDLVRAIVSLHTLSIDAYAGNTFDKATSGGHFYTDKAPGLSFASVPVEVLLHALSLPHAEGGSLALYVVTVAVIGTTSALAAGLLFLAFVRMGMGRLSAATAVAAWLFGTNAFGYATLYYGHQFAAALLAIGFSLLLFAKADSPVASLAATAPLPASPRIRGEENGISMDDRWLVLLAGFIAGWAAISEYPAAVAAGMLLVYGAAALGPRRMLPFALAGAAPVVLWMTYNDACFGGPLELGYSALANEFHDSMGHGFLGPLGVPRGEALYGILLGEWRGLLPLSPFLILALPGAVLLVRDPRTRFEGRLALAVTVFFVLFNASYVVWSGGASMGPRHLVPMLPFATLMVARALDAIEALDVPLRRAARIASGALIAVSVALSSMTVAVMPELLDQRTIRSPGPGVAPPDMHRPLSTFVVPSFFRGYLSIKGTLPNGQMGIASTAPGHDWDAFNLGEAMGLRGLLSLLPLGLVWASAAVAIVRAAPDPDLRK